MSLPLLNQLDRTVRRSHRVARLTAWAWVAAAAAGAATLLILVDYAGRLSDPGLRWLFSGLFVAAIWLVARRAWHSAVSNPASRLSIAERFQQRHPEWGSRLASAVEFIEQPSGDPGAGSEELRRSVVVETASRAEDAEFDEVIDHRPLRLAGRSLAGVGLLLLLFAAINTSALAIGLARLAAPWRDLPWPRLTRLELVEPVEVAPRGGEFEAVVENQLGPTPDGTRIQFRYEGGDVETQPMRPVGDRAVARVERVERSFAYRAVGGDDDTMRWIELRVIDPPRVSELRIEIEPPDYSGMGISESVGSLRVLDGSRIRLAAVANEPVASAVVEIPAGSAEQLFEAAWTDPPERGFVCEWTATPLESGSTYQIVLRSKEAIEGRDQPRRYEVLTDEPPRVVWRSAEQGGYAEQELLVTPRAMVPIAALATDDLSVASVALEWELSVSPLAEAAIENEDESPSGPREPIILYDAGDAPANEVTLDEDHEAPVRLDWDLEPLGLPVGGELLLSVAASDFRPQQGRTERPRRVRLVSDEELESLLSEKQARLVGEIRLAIERQTSARQATRGLLADTRESPPGRAELDRLTSVEFEQRRAAETVGDPATGALRQAERLLDEITRNRLDRPELVAQLSSARDSLDGLNAGELPETQRDLAAARREGPRAAADPESRQRFGERLASAEAMQGDTIEALERVAESLSGWSDFQRFAQELAALEQSQRELSERAAKRLAELAGDPLRSVKLRAEREKLLGRQAEVTRRFTKLAEAMRAMVRREQQSGETSTESARATQDALAEAEQRDIAGRMRDAARDLALSRLGAASASQSDAAQGMREMLDALRQRTIGDPNELVKQLREAQERLAELQRDLESQQRPEDQQRVAEQAEQLGRRLNRLTAPQAADSTQQGARSLEDQQAGSQEQAARAQQSFEQARKEIEQRIEQLENEQTQRLLDRLAAQIGGYIETQDGLLRETQRLDALLDSRGPGAAGPVEAGARSMAADQSGLESTARDFSRELAKRAVFELALRTAADDMLRAVERLDEAVVDRATQRAERSALRRLKQIAEVLKQNQQLNEQNQNQQQQGGEGQGGAGAQPPSPIDVAELRMLRQMQLELITETDDLEADLAAASRENRPVPPASREIAQRLTEQQRRLAELALEMAQRNNDPEAEPPTPEAPSDEGNQL